MRKNLITAISLIVFGLCAAILLLVFIVKHTKYNAKKTYTSANVVFFHSTANYEWLEVNTDDDNHYEFEKEQISLKKVKEKDFEKLEQPSEYFVNYCSTYGYDIRIKMVVYEHKDRQAESYIIVYQKQ